MSLKSLTSKFLKVAALPFMMAFQSISSFGMEASVVEHPVFNKNMPMNKVVRADLRGESEARVALPKRRSVRDLRRGGRGGRVGVVAEDLKARHNGGGKVFASEVQCGDGVVQVSIDKAFDVLGVEARVGGVQAPYDEERFAQWQEQQEAKRRIEDEAAVKEALEAEADLSRVWEREDEKARVGQAGLSAQERLALDRAYKRYTQSAPVHVVKTIQEVAGEAEDIPYYYLFEQARAESQLGAFQSSDYSSAETAFHITDQTWLSMIYRNWRKYDIYIHDKTRDDILAMRDDVALSVRVAQDLGREYRDAVEGAGHADRGVAGWHMLHVLGQRDGLLFLDQLRDNPTGYAYESFPDAVATTEHAFFDKETGAPLTFEAMFASYADGFERSERFAEGITEDILERSEEKVANALAALDALERDFERGHMTLSYNDKARLGADSSVPGYTAAPYPVI